ncbi:hypothetical protein [Thermocoleostomius sinensis]|uniref:Uncharacterized protein n=1 Tax=Thermocoleostomius sinensis A174 TaxID=2016057 RepID=A0A9E9C9L2_9CYAN|nr:hypothetical protein [Thermocoleostomius sinensis]WAL61728.1 hypothetical protein OXH18_07010 [Thermocoleostomius sinensis A174]
MSDNKTLKRWRSCLLWSVRWGHHANFWVEPLTNRFNLADVLTGAIVGRTLIFFLILLLPNFITFIILASLLGITNSFPMPLISAILSVNTDQREQGEI